MHNIAFNISIWIVNNIDKMDLPSSDQIFIKNLPSGESYTEIWRFK